MGTSHAAKSSSELNIVIEENVSVDHSDEHREGGAPAAEAADGRAGAAKAWADTPRGSRSDP